MWDGRETHVSWQLALSLVLVPFSLIRLEELEQGLCLYHYSWVLRHLHLHLPHYRPRPHLHRPRLRR